MYLLSRCYLKISCSVTLINVVRCNSSSRKLLFPLMKSLHPDMFAQESSLVQNVNIACIQNLNSLWDCLDVLMEGMISARKYNLSNVELRNPFLQSYNLNCFIREMTVTDSNQSKVHRKEFSIKVSPFLCTKGTLTMDLAKQNINDIFVQHGRIFDALGLTNPWCNVQTNSANDGDRNRYNWRSGNDRVDSTTLRDLYSELFDKAVTRNAQHALGSASVATLLGDTLPTFSMHTSYARKLSLKRREDQVNKYISGGKVLVRGISAMEEIEALNRFKQFLIDYGCVMNFTLERWSNVVFVLQKAHLKSKKMKATAEQSNNVTVKTIQTSEHDNNQHGFVYEFKKINSKHSLHIVSVPCNFKTSKLLEYLRVRLPVTNITDLLK